MICGSFDSYVICVSLDRFDLIQFWKLRLDSITQSYGNLIFVTERSEIILAFVCGDVFFLPGDRLKCMTKFQPSSAKQIASVSDIYISYWHCCYHGCICRCVILFNYRDKSEGAGAWRTVLVTNQKKKSFKRLTGKKLRWATKNVCRWLMDCLIKVDVDIGGLSNSSSSDILLSDSTPASRINTYWLT